jgi:virginiamycin B lyase
VYKFAPLLLCTLLMACGTASPTAIVPQSTLAPQPTSIAEATDVPGTQIVTPTRGVPPAQPTATQLIAPTTQPPPTSSAATTHYELQEFSAPAGSHPHDVAPAADGGIWYTAQGQGALGYLDVKTGTTRQIPLGRGSAPHGVILGPDHAPWITDGGLNAIVRVDPATDKVEIFPLPDTHRGANLNTAVFDKNGVLWFTGQGGVYGRLDPKTGKVEAWDAPRGVGPYGITTTPNGDVYYASLAGSHIARINPQTGEATVIEPPTPRQGARRVWSDSKGRVWVSEWNVGQVGMYDPAKNVWREWKLPGDHPQTYAVYVDENDQVWLSDFGGNALVHFDPVTEKFDVYPLSSSPANIRQILGRPGEVWGAESGVDRIVVARARE